MLTITVYKILAWYDDECFVYNHYKNRFDEDFRVTQENVWQYKFEETATAIEYLWVLKDEHPDSDIEIQECWE